MGKSGNISSAIPKETRSLAKNNIFSALLYTKDVFFFRSSF